MRRLLIKVLMLPVGIIVYGVIRQIVNVPVSDEQGRIVGRLGDYKS